MQISNEITRRSFLKKTTGAAVGAVSFPYIVSSSALGAGGNVAASNRITVGCIGVGPQGTGVMGGFLRREDARVVAVSDVKSNVLADRQARVNKHYGTNDTKAYKDYRDLINREDIDIVSVATTDHWHVLTRENYYSSPAIRTIADKIFIDADCTPEDISFFDLQNHRFRNISGSRSDTTVFFVPINSSHSN